MNNLLEIHCRFCKLEEDFEKNLSNACINCIVDKLITFCTYGFKEGIDIVYNKCNEVFDIVVTYSCLKISCIYNNINIAKWFYEKFKSILIIDLNDNWIFRNCCKHGNFEICKWLYEICPTMKIYALNYYSIKWATMNKDIRIVEWLYNIQKIECNMVLNDMITTACKYNALNIVKWFVKINKKNILLENIIGFEYCFIHKQMEICNYFVQLRPHKYIIYEHGYYINNLNEEKNARWDARKLIIMNYYYGNTVLNIQYDTMREILTYI